MIIFPVICIKINMTKKFTLHVEQWQIVHGSKSQIYNVCRLVVINTVMAQSPFRQNLRTFVWRKINPNENPRLWSKNDKYHVCFSQSSSLIVTLPLLSDELFCRVGSSQSLGVQRWWWGGWWWQLLYDWYCPNAHTLIAIATYCSNVSFISWTVRHPLSGTFL